jgi:hypothetical protein
MHTPGLFSRHLSLLQHRFAGCRLSRHRLTSFWKLGLELKVSHLGRILTCCTPPNRVHFEAHINLFITDWQFASSCSPRSDFAAAVTFSYRSVDDDLTGTRTPLHRLLRSRTTQPLRGGPGGGSKILESGCCLKCAGRSHRWTGQSVF